MHKTDIEAGDKHGERYASIEAITTQSRPACLAAYSA